MKILVTGYQVYWFILPSQFLERDNETDSIYQACSV